MSTYVDPDEFERIKQEHEKDVFVTYMSAPAYHMQKAEILIDKFRELHRTVDFRCHTCLCNDNMTLWRFMYGIADQDIVEQEQQRIFAEVFATELNTGEAGVVHNKVHPSNVAPCVCPFSMR